MLKFLIDLIIFSDKLRTFECFKFEEGLATETDILDVEPSQGKCIFFLDTSCKSRVEGSISLSARQACVVESAARNNPGREVIVLITAPAAINVTAAAGRYLLPLLTYKNLRIHSVNVDRYLENTPIEGLWKSRQLLKIVKERWRIVHLSDLLRFITLWRYGGIYLDFDMYTLQSYEGESFTKFN